MFCRIGTYSLFALGILLFGSCRKQNMCDCFKPRGETLIENRATKSFNTIQVFDKIDVYYTEDSTATVSSVKVVTGRNLMSSVQTEVNNGVLQIKNLNKCNFARGSHNDITVYITAPAVKTFIQDGVGNFYATNTVTGDSVIVSLRNSGDIHLHLQTNHFASHAHGVGDLYLDGNASDYYSYSVGQGFIHAENLNTSTAYMYFGSNGEAHIKVASDLNAVLTSTGNIYYSGNPSVRRTGLGKGKLIHN